jgi:Holliday junction resolvasome RuvABC endonuclease subunit
MTILAADPGTINFGWAVLSPSGAVLESGHIDGKFCDTYAGFCDVLSRVQRKYGRDNVTVAIEDAVSYGEAKAGLFKLVALVDRVRGWCEAKGCEVVKMRRVDVVRAFGLKGKVSKARARSMAKLVFKRDFETEHECDAAMVGWVVARRLMAQRDDLLRRARARSA